MPQTLKERVEKLEAQVQKLTEALENAKPARDWRKSIGAFKDDPGYAEMARIGREIREKDRAKAKRNARP